MVEEHAEVRVRARDRRLGEVGEEAVPRTPASKKGEVGGEVLGATHAVDWVRRAPKYKSMLLFEEGCQSLGTKTLELSSEFTLQGSFSSELDKFSSRKALITVSVFTVHDPKDALLRCALLSFNSASFLLGSAGIGGIGGALGILLCCCFSVPTMPLRLLKSAELLLSGSCNALQASGSYGTS